MCHARLGLWTPYAVWNVPSAAGALVPEISSPMTQNVVFACGTHPVSCCVVFWNMSSKRPPQLNAGVASALITRLFPFKHVSHDSFKELPSYDDRNMYFEGIVEESTELKPFVLKLSNAHLYTPELVDGLNKMMLFVESRGFVCGGPVASRTGQYSHMATEQELLGGESVANGGAELEAVEYPVRVMKYIPGELMDELDKCYLTPQLSYDVGNYVGRMDCALQEFHHPAVDDRFYDKWDLQYFTNLKKFIPHVKDEQKKEKAYIVMAAYEAHILPRLPSMKKGVIYNDANGLNIILQKVGEKYELTGMIDFGDSVRTCYLFELAVMLTYGMVEKDNPVEFVAPMLRGYLDAFPLSREELECLYYAVLARLCQSAVTGEYQFTLEPWNTYLLATPNEAWKLIDLFLTLTKDRVEEIWHLWD